MQSLHALLAAVAIALPLVACSSEGSSLPPLDKSNASDVNYHLGPGDKVHVSVAGAEDLSGDYTIGDNGSISMPLIGDVAAAGMTRAQVESAMEKKLADGYLKHPKVSIGTLGYRPFYIFGEVLKPGEYPYAAGMRVMSAVATAGGFTYRANQQYVVVTRNGQERRADPTAEIQPDDVIKVPERYF
jgi:polysaccharide export outer membrane protein